MDITFDEVVKLAEQLDTEHQNLLIERLRVKQMRDQVAQGLIQRSPSPTREELLREVETLRQTPVQPGNNSLDKYANPNVPEISDEELRTQIHAIATEWEQELDDYSSNKP